MKYNRLIINIFVFFLILFFVTLGAFGNVNRRIVDNFYGNSIKNDDIIILAIDDPSLANIGRWPWNRDVYAELIEKTNCASVIGFDIIFSEESEYDSILENSLTNNIVLAVEYSNFEIKNNKLFARNLLVPREEFLDKVDLGYINVITDSDGITRHFNLNLKSELDIISFPEIIAKKYLESNNIEFEGIDENAKNKYMINYVGPPGSFEYFSISEALELEDCSIFENKILLVGATSQNLHDVLDTPTSRGTRMPGVEVHANAINTILQKNNLREQNNFGIIFTILAINIFLYFIYSKKIIFSAIVSGISIFILLFIGIIVFERFNLLMNIFYPITTIAIGSFANISFLYTTESQRKKEIMNAFGKYVSPDVISDILKNPKKLNLGGERKTISILFSDIRGFTSLSEKLSPEQLVSLLNEYLSDMTEIILENKGLVDKYIGDAIMALWGTPVDTKDHAEKSCKSALNMIIKLEKLNKELTRKGIPTIEIGIGINTGPAVVGNMGSEQRFDYTAMGDSVNLSSRLEGLNKTYGTNIIISESTKKRLPDTFATRLIDKVKVKGKKEPVEIFELYSKNKKIDTINFEKGLKLYFKGEFEKAIKIFENCKNDATAKIFIKRCKIFIESPPKEWDGVFEMKTK